MELVSSGIDKQLGLYDQELKKEIAKMIKTELESERSISKKSTDALKMAFESTVKEIEQQLSD